MLRACSADLSKMAIGPIEGIVPAFPPVLSVGRR
jgi:hypothetical protein